MLFIINKSYIKEYIYLWQFWRLTLRNTVLLSVYIDSQKVLSKILRKNSYLFLIVILKGENKRMKNTEVEN